MPTNGDPKVKDTKKIYKAFVGKILTRIKITPAQVEGDTPYLRFDIFDLNAQDWKEFVEPLGCIPNSQLMTELWTVLGFTEPQKDLRVMYNLMGIRLLTQAVTSSLYPQKEKAIEEIVTQDDSTTGYGVNMKCLCNWLGLEYSNGKSKAISMFAKIIEFLAGKLYEKADLFDAARKLYTQYLEARRVFQRAVDDYEDNPADGWDSVRQKYRDIRDHQDSFGTALIAHLKCTSLEESDTGVNYEGYPMRQIKKYFEIKSILMDDKEFGDAMKILPDHGPGYKTFYNDSMLNVYADITVFEENEQVDRNIWQSFEARNPNPLHADRDDNRNAGGNANAAGAAAGAGQPPPVYILRTDPDQERLSREESATRRRNEMQKRMEALKERAENLIAEMSRSSKEQGFSSSMAQLLMDDAKELKKSIERHNLENPEKQVKVTEHGTPRLASSVLSTYLTNLAKKKGELEDEKKKQEFERKSKKEDLKNKVVPIPCLENEENFIHWYKVIKMHIEKLGPDDADLEKMLLNQIKESLNKRDYVIVKNKETIAEILEYINNSYLSNSSNLFSTRLNKILKISFSQDLYNLKKNISEILSILEDIVLVKMQSLIESKHVIHMEAVCFRTRERDLYMKEKSQFLSLTSHQQSQFLKGEIELPSTTKSLAKTNTLLMGLQGNIGQAKDSTKDALSKIKSTIDGQSDKQDLLKVIQFLVLKLLLQQNIISNEIKTEEEVKAAKNPRKSSPEKPERGKRLPQRFRGKQKGISKIRWTKQYPPNEEKQKSDDGKGKFQRGNQRRKFHQDDNKGFKKRKFFRGNTRRGRGRGNFRQNRDRGMIICPFNCSTGRHARPDDCNFFRKLDLDTRRRLVNKLKNVTRCCLRLFAHKPEQKCKITPPCKFCGKINHHFLICSSPQAYKADQTRSKSIVNNVIVRKVHEEPDDEDQDEYDHYGYEDFDEDEYDDSEYQEDYDEEYDSESYEDFDYEDDEEEEEESYQEDEIYDPFPDLTDQLETMTPYNITDDEEEDESEKNEHVNVLKIRMVRVVNDADNEEPPVQVELPPVPVPVPQAQHHYPEIWQPTPRPHLPPRSRPRGRPILPHPLIRPRDPLIRPRNPREHWSPHYRHHQPYHQPQVRLPSFHQTFIQARVHTPQHTTQYQHSVERSWIYPVPGWQPPPQLFNTIGQTVYRPELWNQQSSEENVSKSCRFFFLPIPPRLEINLKQNIFFNVLCDFGFLSFCLTALIVSLCINGGTAIQNLVGEKDKVKIIPKFQDLQLQPQQIPEPVFMPHHFPAAPHHVPIVPQDGAVPGPSWRPDAPGPPACRDRPPYPPGSAAPPGLSTEVPRDLTHNVHIIRETEGEEAELKRSDSVEVVFDIREEREKLNVKNEISGNKYRSYKETGKKRKQNRNTSTELEKMMRLLAVTFKFHRVDSHSSLKQLRPTSDLVKDQITFTEQMMTGITRGIQDKVQKYCHDKLREGDGGERVNLVREVAPGYIEITSGDKKMGNLFDFILNEASFLHNWDRPKPLTPNFDVLILPPSGALKKLQGKYKTVKVRLRAQDYGKGKYCTCVVVRALGDTGAEANVISSELIEDGLTYASNEGGNKIAGISGNQENCDKHALHLIENNYVVPFTAAQSTMWVGERDKSFSMWEKNIFRHSFQITSKLESKFNLNKETKDIKIIIGMKALRLCGDRLNIQELLNLGLTPPVSSPNLHVWKSPVAYPPYLVVGSPGVPGDMSIVCPGSPRFTIPDAGPVRGMNLSCFNVFEWERQRIPLNRGQYVSRNTGRSIPRCSPEEQNAEIGEDLRVNINHGEIHELSSDNVVSALLERNVLEEDQAEYVDLINEITPDNATLVHGEEDEFGTCDCGSFIRNVRELNNFELAMQAEGQYFETPQLCAGHQNQVRTCLQCSKNPSSAPLRDQKLMEQIKLGCKKVNTGEKDSDGNPVYRLVYDLISDKPIAEIFAPEKSNRAEAEKNAKVTRDKLERLDLIHQFNELFEDDLKNGFIKELTPEEVKKLDKTPHYFLLSGYQSSPKIGASTPLRKIVDSSRAIKDGGVTHSGVIRSPKDILQNLIAVRLAASLHEANGTIDLKKAYRMLMLNERSSYLCLSLWYNDYRDPSKGFRIFRAISAGFGVAQSPALLEDAQLSHVVPACKTEEAKIVLQSQRFADDCGESSPDPETLKETFEDLKKAEYQLGFPIKPVTGPLWVFKDVLDHYPTGEHVTFGYVYNMVLNSHKPSTELNPTKPRRGQKVGPPLHKVNLWDDKFVFTKRIALRLSAQLFEVLSKVLSPAQIQAKLLLSEVFKAFKETEGNSYDLDIRPKNPQLDTKLRSFWSRMANYQEIIQPILGYVIPYGYVAKSMTVFHDGSQSAFSAVLYIVSQKENPSLPGPEYFSYIADSKAIIGRGTHQVNESLGFPLALKMVEFTLRALRHKIAYKDFNITLLGDSRSTSHYFSLERTIGETRVRNAINKAAELCNNIVQIGENTTLHLSFIPGPKNIADFNSKAHANCIDLMNSSAWRHGNLYNVDNKLAQQMSFVKCTREKGIQYRQLPPGIMSAEGKDDMKNLKSDLRVNQRFVQSTSKKKPPEEKTNPEDENLDVEHLNKIKAKKEIDEALDIDVDNILNELEDQIDCVNICDIPGEEPEPDDDDLVSKMLSQPPETIEVDTTDLIHFILQNAKLNLREKQRFEKPVETKPKLKQTIDLRTLDEGQVFRVNKVTQKGKSVKKYHGKPKMVSIKRELLEKVNTIKDEIETQEQIDEVGDESTNMEIDPDQDKSLVPDPLEDVPSDPSCSHQQAPGPNEEEKMEVILEQVRAKSPEPEKMEVDDSVDEYDQEAEKKEYLKRVTDKFREQSFCSDEEKEYSPDVYEYLDSVAVDFETMKIRSTQESEKQSTSTSETEDPEKSNNEPEKNLESRKVVMNRNKKKNPPDKDNEKFESISEADRNEQRLAVENNKKCNYSIKTPYNHVTSVKKIKHIHVEFEANCGDKSLDNITAIYPQPEFLGVLSKEFLEEIVKGKRNMYKHAFLEMIKKLSLVLRFIIRVRSRIRRKKTLEEKQENKEESQYQEDYHPLFEAFLLLVRSDQTLYKIKVGNGIFFCGNCRLFLISFRVNQKDVNTLGPTRLPIIQKGSLLVEEAIRHAHERKMTLDVSGHHAKITTIVNCKTAWIGLYIVNIQEKVNKFFLNCTVCLRSKLVPYSLKIGTRFTGAKNLKMFTEISIDPLGEIEVKIRESDRKTTKVTPVLVCCLHTGYLMNFLLFEATKYSMRALVTRIETYTLTKCLKVVTDAGRCFSGFLQGKEITHIFLPAKGQHCNFVETRCRVYKTLHKRLQKIARQEPVKRVNTFSIHQHLQDIAVYLVNSIPYQSSSHSMAVIAPIDLLFPLRNSICSILQITADDCRNLVSIDKFYAMVDSIYKQLWQLRNECLIAQNKTYCDLDSANKSNIEPRKFDVCLYKVKDVHSPAKLCQILNISKDGSGLYCHFSSNKKKWISSRHVFILCRYRYPENQADNTENI